MNLADIRLLNLKGLAKLGNYKWNLDMVGLLDTTWVGQDSSYPPSKTLPCLKRMSGRFSPMKQLPLRIQVNTVKCLFM